MNSRKVKAYPAVPEEPPEIEYVPTWRDYLPDFAAAVLLVILGMFVGVLIVGVLA